MIHAVVAESAGVVLGDLDSLLAGRVYASAADKLGIPMGYVESYINSGSAAAVLAERLGVNMLAAEDLGARPAEAWWTNRHKKLCVSPMPPVAMTYPESRVFHLLMTTCSLE